ncbi:MAG TPA: MFS transporter [Gammaproteobacteria bacterium]|nr:MFS transporter [Gammaproteobacteria bacterium]
MQSVGDPASGLIAQPVRSLLRQWGESPAAIAAFMAVMALPWSLKPLLALLADFVPLFGSRRRNYLIAATAVAALGLTVLYASPILPGERWLLLTLLFLPTLAIAFGDVLADALMIEIGQPRGLTGRLQAVQWFAAYAALLLSGVLGGYLAAIGQHDLAFLFCAILWAFTLILTVLFVRERRSPVTHQSVRAAASALRAALAVPGLATICAITFIWDFNPLWVSVLYLHVTDTLGMSEQVYGNGYSLFSAGAMAASLAYGVYCRRVRTAVLLHACIVAGIVANVLYWSIDIAASLYTAFLLAGFAYMTGSLILLDLAARLVPVPVAATVFALIMALANLGSSLAEALGGYLVQALATRFEPSAAYQIIVAISASIVASCWLWLPRLHREVPDWWSVAQRASRGP